MPKNAASVVVLQTIAEKNPMELRIIIRVGTYIVYVIINMMHQHHYTLICNYCASQNVSTNLIIIDKNKTT